MICFFKNQIVTLKIVNFKKKISILSSKYFCNVTNNLIKFNEKQNTNDKKTIFQYPEQINLFNVDYKTDDWTNVTNHIINFFDRKLYKQQDNPIYLISEGIKNHFSDYDSVEFLNPIVTTQANFDSLLISEDHVSRNKSDCYYINKEYILRSHTSAHQLDCLKDKKLKKFTCIADVYRRDTIDNTHYPVFHQCEIFNVLDKIPSNIKVLETNLNSENNSEKQKSYTLEVTKYAEKILKKTVENYLKFLFDENLEMRWVSAYFPFTCPSFELEILHKGKWIEMLGCGIVERQILLNSGLNNEIGFAIGFGLERLAMLKYNIPDIRIFWSKDKNFSQQFKSKTFKDKIEFKSLFSYLSTYKDCSFWENQNFNFHENDFYDLAREVGGEIIEKVSLIDEFNKEGRKSKTFRINYHSHERYLSKKEIVDLHEKIKQELRKRFEVETRG